MYKYYFFVAIFILGITMSFIVGSEQPKPKYETKPAPEVLKHFTNLEGEWVGMHKNHEGEEEQVTLIYRTVSGGTAVEERIFANTPKEMITVYHGANDGGVLMTHYCMLGNQPRLQLENTHEQMFKFTYLDGVGIDRDKTGHMGGMRLTILDENTIQHEWDYYEDGEVKNSSKFTFTRK